MDFMGFDEYIYIVRVIEEGNVTEFEFGNPEHDLALKLIIPEAKLVRYKDGIEYESSQRYYTFFR